MLKDDKCMGVYNQMMKKNTFFYSLHPACEYLVQKDILWNLDLECPGSVRQKLNLRSFNSSYKPGSFFKLLSPHENNQISKAA